MRVPSVTEVSDDVCAAMDIALHMLRLDEVHAEVPGNKWFKLKHNFEAARQTGHTTIITFGGAYSNHIAATAAAASMLGFRTVGIIRGEEEGVDNPVLRYARKCGMQLHFISRADYKLAPEVILDKLKILTPGFLIPAGGDNCAGIKGAQEIFDYCKDYDVVCCPVGTGTTLAGLTVAAPPSAQLIGFSALKGGNQLLDYICRQAAQCGTPIHGHNLEIRTDFHFGGFGKTTLALDLFIRQFEVRTGIALEHVYTGKMMWGVNEMIKKDFFPSGSRILAIHTGGFREK